MIRELKVTDLERIMAIWLHSNIEAHPFVPEKYWVSNYQMVQEQIAQAEVYVMESEGEIQGFIGLSGSYIAGIFVDKKYRSKGVGRQLLEYVRKQYSSLSLQVYQQNKRAVDFYLREGFCVKTEETDETGNAEFTMEWKR